MKRRLIFSVVLALAMLVSTFVACAEPAKPAATSTAPAASTPAAPAKVIKWRAEAAWSPGQAVIWDSAKRYVDKVNEAAKGRLVIELIPGGGVVPIAQIQDAVSKGSIDMGLSCTSYVLSVFPAAAIFGESCVSGAGAFDPNERFAWDLQGGGLDLLQEMYDAKQYNVKVLPNYAITTAEGFGWSHKPIRTLEDFKGVKFRTIGYWGEALQSMGASVVGVPGGEVYSALERKVIDAAEYSTAAVDKSLAFYEICKYYITPGVHQPATPLETIVNKNRWNELPDDLKALLWSVAIDNCGWSISYSTVMDGAAIDFYKQKGVEIIRLSPEVVSQIVDVGTKLVDSKAEKDPFIAKIVKSRRDFDAKWKTANTFLTVPWPAAK